jgi:heterogeneous nuclear rnp K-like protein 2
MAKRRGSNNEEHEDNEPKRLAIENRDTSPVSVLSGFDARNDSHNSEDHGHDDNDSEGEGENRGEDNHENGRGGTRNNPDLSRTPEIEGSSREQNDDTFIHMRVLVADKEAGELIGRKGQNLVRVREATGVRYNVSESYDGAVDRIVNIKGTAEHVAKAAGLLVRVLNDEPFDNPSSPDAKKYNLNILMPHHIMGALIGKGGSKFREIEEASAARIKAQDKPMPFSNDRCMSVYGVADAIHIAVYYIAITYTTHQELLRNHRHNAYDPRSSARNVSRSYVPVGRYNGGGGRGNSGRTEYQEQDLLAGHSIGRIGNDSEGSQDSKQMYIPDGYVGAVIGRGGQKIQEIRRVSNCIIKVTETRNMANERLVLLTGSAESVRHATYLIQARIESEIKREENGS